MITVCYFSWDSVDEFYACVHWAIVNLNVGE